MRKWGITRIHELGDDQATSRRELAQGILRIRKDLDWRYNQNKRNEWVEMLSSTGMVQDNHMGRGGVVTVNYDPRPQVGRDGHTAKDRLLGSALSDTICADPSTLAELDDDRLPP